MPKIVTTGRTDVDEYFKLSGVLEYERLNHTPLLVFLSTEDSVRVQIVYVVNDLLGFPDDTPVMSQWRGEWRSDFFQFTVRQYHEYIEKKNQPLQSARNVIKTVGPNGGFRYMTYEYDDENGRTIRSSVHSKPEAARLESIFQQFNIPVLVQTIR
jgi:hypothetical protein